MTRLFAFALLLVAAPALAQEGTDRPLLVYEPVEEAVDPADEVRAAVVALFDAMRAGDTTGVRAVMHPRATLQSVVPAEEGYRIQVGSIDAFVGALGQHQGPPWNEQIGPISVDLDAGLAQAWMAYRFLLGDQFSHCGVNAMQLVHQGEGWQILNIVDTRRRECDPLDG